jgi:AP-1-like transcription factor
MASINATPSNFILTPQQQALLFRALASNQQPNNASPQNNALSLSPTSLTKSPAQDGTGPAKDSPLLDFNYDFDPDNSLDFDFVAENSAAMIGDLPESSKAGSPENENSDKRSHPDDEDGEKEEGNAKRRESEGKVPKKPGRKPLTNEPSSVSNPT